MVKAFVVSVVVISASIVGVSNALAYNGVGFSGASCQPLILSSSNMIDHQAGQSGPTGGSGQMVCPISYPQNTVQYLLYDSIQVELYDNATSGDLACTPFSWIPGAGSGVYGATRHTCGTWGGCSTNSSPSSAGFTTLFFNNSDSYLGYSTGGHNYVADYSTTVVFCSFPLDMYNAVWAYRFYLN